MPKIGRISATEKNPSSCDQFSFWLEDNVRISPFDVVRVENNIDGFNSTTFAQVQDIFHCTDSPGHISSYVSSDFGDADAKMSTMKLSVSYATATVIHNDNDNYMPIRDGCDVYTATEEDITKALGLDLIDPDSAICAGLLKTSSGVAVPVSYNSDFLIGPEGAHLNISGISGLATKTSYAMFLLLAIQQRIPDCAVIILNVKGDDLLNIHIPNSEMTASRRKDWDKLKLRCEPFQNVRYFYPYKQKDRVFSNTVLDTGALQAQYDDGIAKNFVYTYSHDKEKLDLLFSNVDDPGFTIDSILNYISQSSEFNDDGLNWQTFLNKVHDYSSTSASKSNKDIATSSWRKFSRLLSNSIHDSLFVSSISKDPHRHQCHLSEEIQQIQAGQTLVVDVAKLDEQLQYLVFGDVIKSVYDMKHEEDRSASTPRRVVVFVDELNKYAPSTSPKGSPILSQLLEITERGRYEGVLLFSAEQFRSAVHDRVKGNCSTHVYGRTNAIEISKPDYKYIPKVYANMMTRLGKGDLIIQHPVFKTLLKIAFPYPSYQQRK